MISGSRKSNALEIKEEPCHHLQNRQVIGSVEEYVHFDQQKQHAKEFFRKNGKVIRIKLPPGASK